MNLIKKVIILMIAATLVLGMVASSLAMEYNEAPMLKKMVGNGEVPPISERLPEEPLVVGPGVLVPEGDLDWQVGKYGGTLTTAHESPGYSPNQHHMFRFEGLLAVPGFMATQEIYPNILKDYEVNEDSTEFTFYMRKGLKWSDGYPVTTEDIRFTYEEVLKNEKLTASVPVKFRAGGVPTGEPMKLEVIDDYTFKVSFDEPYGMFLIKLGADYARYDELLQPKHYLKNYHIKYTPLEEMKSELEDQELTDEWWDLFNIKNFNEFRTPEDIIGCPVLYPWKMVEGPKGTIVFERNPYYFKVDEAGNQLPYIDKLVSYEVADSEMLTMKAITGEIDFLFQGTSVEKAALYKDQEERGGFKTYFLKGHGNPGVMYFNYTHDDPVWREVVNNVDLRRALNMAIDREEIIEQVYKGMATLPDEWVPCDYDPEQAKQILDEIGMDAKDRDGYRLGPDGETFAIYIETTAFSPDYETIPQLISEYWKNVGVKTEMKLITGGLLFQKAAANNLMAAGGWGHPQTWPDVQRSYMPGQFGFGQKWAAWYNTNGREGEEPPAWIKELYQIDERILSYVPGTEEKQKAIDELKAWYNKYIPAFHSVGDIVDPVIVDANVGNVPTSGFGMTATIKGEQLFFKGE